MKRLCIAITISMWLSGNSLFLGCELPQEENPKNDTIPDGVPGGIYDADFNCSTCDTFQEVNSALELRNVELNGTILDAIYTIGKDRGYEIYKGNNKVWYVTAYEDTVYYQVASPPRILILSRCPLYNLGQSRRMDSELWDAIFLLKDADPGMTNQELATYLFGLYGRIYYSQSEKAYSRVSIVCTDAPASGHVSVPNGALAVGFCCGSIGGWGNYLGVTLFVDGTERSSIHKRNSSPYYTSVWTGNLSAGTHSIECDWDCNGVEGCFTPNPPWRVYLLDAAGENCFQSMTAEFGGNSQPVIWSKSISDLVRP